MTNKFSKTKQKKIVTLQNGTISSGILFIIFFFFFIPRLSPNKYGNFIAATSIDEWEKTLLASLKVGSSTPLALLNSNGKEKVTFYDFFKHFLEFIQDMSKIQIGKEYGP